MRKSLFHVLGATAVLGATLLTTTAASAAVTAAGPPVDTVVTFAVTTGDLTVSAPGSLILGTALPGTTVSARLTNQEEDMRRLLGTITLAAVAGTGPAIGPAVAVAATQPQSGPAEEFGARLVDVPVSEANNPRGLRYIIDYLPTGTTIHRRIFVQNHEKRTVHFTVYPDAAHISDELFTGSWCGVSASAAYQPDEVATQAPTPLQIVTIGYFRIT